MESNSIASLGWFGHSNCGDEMFKDALVSLFPEYNFTFYSELLNNIDSINKADYLLIGGGNIVDPAFLSGLDKVKVPYSFIGVGLPDDRHVHLLSGAKEIYCRDNKSVDFASSVKGFVHKIPDLGFCLVANKEKGKEFLYSLPNMKRNLPTLGIFLNDCVNINFNSTILKSTEYQKFTLELARFLDGKNYNIVFLPMSFTPPDDRRISLDVVGKMKTGYRTHCIVNPLKSQDCLDLTSAFDYALTMRLHSAIFCTIGGVPFIDITHHSKNKGYLETEGLQDLSMDYYELSIQTLNSKFAYLMDSSKKIKERLLKQTNRNKLTLYETVKNVYLP